MLAVHLTLQLFFYGVVFFFFSKERKKMKNSAVKNTFTSRESLEISEQFLFNYSESAAAKFFDES